MARVALVQAVKNDFLDAFSTNLGLPYLSSYLKREGHEIKYTDMNNVGGFTPCDSSTHADRVMVLARDIHEFEPEYVGISVIGGRVDSTADIAMRVKAGRPNVKVIVGRPKTTRNTKEVLERTGADFAVRGDVGWNAQYHAKLILSSVWPFKDGACNA